jgi:hypothetical protein
MVTRAVLPVPAVISLATTVLPVSAAAAARRRPAAVPAAPLIAHAAGAPLALPLALWLAPVPAAAACCLDTLILPRLGAGAVGRALAERDRQRGLDRRGARVGHLGAAPVCAAHAAVALALGWQALAPQAGLYVVLYFLGDAREDGFEIVLVVGEWWWCGWDVAASETMCVCACRAWGGWSVAAGAQRGTQHSSTTTSARAKAHHNCRATCRAAAPVASARACGVGLTAQASTPYQQPPSTCRASSKHMQQQHSGQGCSANPPSVQQSQHQPPPQQQGVPLAPVLTTRCWHAHANLLMARCCTYTAAGGTLHAQHTLRGHAPVCSPEVLTCSSSRSRTKSPSVTSGPLGPLG